MAAFSLGDQPLVDLVRSGFSGGEAAGAVSFDEHHPYLNQQRPNYNAVAYNNSLSLSDQFSMEFIPEMNGLFGFDYYAEMTTQPTSVLAQAGDFLGGVGHSQCADSLENNNFNMPALGRKLLLESPLGSHFAVMINDEKAQALYCPSALVNNVDSKLPCIVRMGLQDYVPHSTTAIRMECTNQFGEMLSRSGSEYTTHKRLENKCKRLRGANACEDLEDDSDPKIDLCKESSAEYAAKVVKKGEKAESPKGFIHVRARRGEATDSHSLAERVRREKIRERMKRLQDLVPGCSKVTGKAQLLDEIINYIQSLQSQVELLSVKLAFVIRHCNFHVQVDGNPSQEQIEQVLSVQGNTIPVAACDTAVNHVEEGETTAEPQMAGTSFSMILNE